MVYLQQNDEELTTINDLIDNTKTYLGESSSMPQWVHIHEEEDQKSLVTA